jgi:AcrR family transcriptional regulator
MPKKQAPSTTTQVKAPTSPWVHVSAREQQRETKRNAVLSTAAQLFNERGFHATSLDDIAARLNVSKPTLYYYVKNKDQILIECVRKGLQMMHEGIEETRRAGGKAIDQLMACMRVYTRIVTLDFGMCVIRVSDDEFEPESRKDLRRLKSGIDMEFRRLVTAGIAEGSLQPCDPKMAAFVIAGALSWIGRWYEADGNYSPEEIATQFNAMLLNGVLRRKLEPAVLPAAASAGARKSSKARAKK